MVRDIVDLLQQIIISYYLLMFRSKFSNQDVFKSEVDRLQKERSKLIRERNNQEFPQRVEESHAYSQVLQRSHQGSEQKNKQYRLDDTKQPRAVQLNGSPNIDEVKLMLDDIAKNPARHNMDKKMSIKYLTDIQAKLYRQIQSFNVSMRRTMETDKLRDLKAFVDRLLASHDVTHPSKGFERIKQVKQGMKRTLQKIPEGVFPSASSLSSSQLISSNSESHQTSSEESRHPVQYNKPHSQSIQENYDKHQTAKKVSAGQAGSILNLLQHKIFKQVSVLRSQNMKLKKDLEDFRRSRSPSHYHRKDSVGENQTIINGLVRTQPKNLQVQNNRLKSKIRTLEMQLLSYKSLRNIDSSSRGQYNDERFLQIIQQKDDEIRYLKIQTQNLISHLQNSKQKTQHLKRQISHLSHQLNRKTQSQHQCNNRIRSMEAEIYRLRAGSSQLKASNSQLRILGKDHQPYYQSNQQEHQHYREESTIPRNISDFRKKSVHFQKRQPVYNSESIQRQNTIHTREKGPDKLGQYRQVLSTLKSLRK